MKVLLLGEYSNVHWTLAQGLRELGVHVTVASAGDSYKNYQRDINLSRRGYGKADTIRFVFNLFKNFRKFKGYDVVQIVNPFFLDMKADRNLQAFHYLKRHNKRVFMGAFGDDSYWLRACLKKNIFRYSEFDIPYHSEQLPAAQKLMEVWTSLDKVRVNKAIAEQSDGVIACLYEYYEAYKDEFSEKLIYIAEPINTKEITFKQRGVAEQPIKFFIGIQTERSQIKGTDVLYKILQKIHQAYPMESQILKAESLPYQDYIQMMDQADILVDQLYSYSPGMNALAAMAKGLIAVSGGEPEIYDLFCEQMNRPIVNVIPSEEHIYMQLENLVQNKQNLTQRSFDSRQFIEQYHDFIKVAQQYLAFWTQ